MIKDIAKPVKRGADTGMNRTFKKAFTRLNNKKLVSALKAKKGLSVWMCQPMNSLF
jgi:hypothetical protein